MHFPWVCPSPHTIIALRHGGNCFGARTTYFLRIRLSENRTEKHSHAESRSIQSPGQRVVLGFFVLQQFQTRAYHSVAVYCCGKEICYEQPLPRASPRVRKNWLKPYPLSRRLRRNSTPAHAWLRTPCLRRLPFDSRRADLRNPALRELHRPPPLPGPPNVLDRICLSLESPRVPHLSLVSDAGKVYIGERKIPSPPV